MLTPLPIDDVLPRIIAALREQPTLVLCAPPGAGKTTRVPPAILDAGLAGEGTILVLQPRRVAARATAARMSVERQSKLGEEIGYRVRFESKVSKRTRIEVVTEGILLRRLLSDSFLDGVSVVVFDEFHERSLASDLALGMVRQVQEIRPELKVVVMSATLAAEPIARYLGNAPIIASEGRMFPVQIRYWPELERRPSDEIAAAAVPEAFRETTGDCLVFLPGVGEIRSAARRLETWAAEQNVLLMELYGDLPPAQQDAVLAPAAQRKVILTTNIAETSLTIDGVTAVIDSGLARVSRYDENLGLDRLELGPISQASAAQRAGRAGRTAPGVCWRLWPEAAHRHRPEFETPEIRRVDLAGALLQILCWIEPDLQRFPWFESPPLTAVEQARELLITLQGITPDGQLITELGRRLAELPLHPRLGRLLLAGAERGVAPRAALAAALLSERDPFQRQPRGRLGSRQPAAFSESDLLDRVLALESFAAEGYTDFPFGSLNRSGAKNILRVQEQLAKLVNRSHGSRQEENEVAFLKAVAAAYLDRLAKRREPHGERGLLVGGRGVRLADESAVRESELFVCVEVDAGNNEAVVRQASHIERDWLPAELVRQETNVFFDAATQKIIARRQTFFRTLLLEERPVGIPNDEAAAAALAEAASKQWDQVFPFDNAEITGFVGRVRCLQQWLPQLELPSLTEADLQQLLPDLALGKRSFAELKQGLWLAAIKGLFTYPQLQSIETQAPERYQVPSGSRIVIQYEEGKPPVLAVRIQELFGLAETPRIAGGRVPLLLHLLGPNYRPEQITSDLASFWKTAYPIVRKDLRGRYPKHSWPDDPLTATAESRPKRRS